ncbi:hypothetical protein AVEN_135865-1 [Araneus ventricosus]|uniref:Uncharacterized protein n=1 Tax=Araneus ventricosus TaxID=182803 RepID=A0A4Y2WFY7_ARAVE|nr:hypothetical protein AVEN_135865-1 [Araneus ventricosus]
MARVLPRWQACNGTGKDGGNAGEEFLCVGICEVFFGYKRSACLSALEHNFPLRSQLPHRWIGRAGLDDVPLLSSDLTPCDFFLWSYVKHKVYVPPMPTTLQAQQERISAAVTDTDGNMLLNVWTELDYR